MKKAYIFIALFAIAAVVVALIPEKKSSLGDVAVSADSLLYVVTEFDHPILQYEGFTVTFNEEMRQPDFVAWELTASKAMSEIASRKDADFAVDESVDGCATLEDYKHSGFDRGHMAPAADMKWSKKAMRDCHYLTNICPQLDKLNSGPWATVEKNCRKWAEKFGVIYIIAGPVLSDQLTRKIGNTPVPVPERFFKVVIAPFNNPPMGIAFLMPNGYIRGGAQSTVTTIDEIEAITGFDFFSALDDEIENDIEAQHSLMKWNR